MLRIVNLTTKSAVLIMVLLLLQSCKKNAKTSPWIPVPDRLDKISQNPHWPEDVRERCGLAKTLWLNQAVDNEPILVRAAIKRSSEPDDVVLFLSCYDENKDLLGIGIKQKIFNGKEWYWQEREFPLFVHFDEFKEQHNAILIEKSPDGTMTKRVLPLPEYLDPTVNVLITRWFTVLPLPVEFDMDIIEKNKQAWTDYIESGNDYNMTNVPKIPIRLSSEGDDNIMIWLYDKVGNKSKPIKVTIFKK